MINGHKVDGYFNRFGTYEGLLFLMSLHKKLSIDDIAFLSNRTRDTIIKHTRILESERLISIEDEIVTDLWYGDQEVHKEECLEILVMIQKVLKENGISCKLYKKKRFLQPIDLLVGLRIRMGAYSKTGAYIEMATVRGTDKFGHKRWWRRRIISADSLEDPAFNLDTAIQKIIKVVRHIKEAQDIMEGIKWVR